MNPRKKVGNTEWQPSRNLDPKQPMSMAVLGLQLRLEIVAQNSATSLVAAYELTEIIEEGTEAFFREESPPPCAADPDRETWMCCVCSWM